MEYECKLCMYSIQLHKKSFQYQIPATMPVCLPHSAKTTLFIQLQKDLMLPLFFIFQPLHQLKQSIDAIAKKDITVTNRFSKYILEMGFRAFLFNEIWAT